MGVLLAMRNVSKVEFLKQLQELQQEVFRWSRSQSPKDKDFGVKKLYSYAEQAFDEAFDANLVYAQDEDEYKDRINHFKASVRNLHRFNSQLTAVNNVLEISNKKVKNWCNHSEAAINLISAVIRNDKRKLKSLKDNG